MDYFEPIETAQAVGEAFDGSTLILPQPSLGSVAQLACDLIIHTIPGFELVGHLGLRDYIPTVSSNESPFSGPCLGTQVFVHRTKKWTVVLPRSPVIKARTQAHLDSLVSFIQQANFSRVLLVAGVDAAARSDDALRSPSPFRSLFLSPEPVTEWSNLRQMTEVEPYNSQRTSESTITESNTGIPLIPAGGMTRRTLEAISSPASTGDKLKSSTAALLAYTADGDNRELAHSFATIISKAIRGNAEGEEQNIEAWKEPASWAVGLEGRELSRETRGELYG